MRRWIFNFLMHNKHFFFCMTDQNFGRVIPFTYLKDLSADFFAKYAEEATSYDGLNDILVQKMNFYNGKELEGKDSAGQQKIDAINKQLDGVKDVMKTNLGSLFRVPMYFLAVYRSQHSLSHATITPMSRASFCCIQRREGARARRKNRSARNPNARIERVGAGL